MRFLWAGRFDLQKRLDLLFKLAFAAPEHEFHIHGSYVHDSPRSAFDTAHFCRLPNVFLHGPFDDFHRLPTEKYDGLLYTSAWDGIPNVLLEAAGAGLPIIAPDVGGIREFIKPENGYLISGTRQLEGYLRAMDRVARRPREAERRAAGAQVLLTTRHSWPRFVAALARVPGYLPDGRPSRGGERR